MLHSGLMVEEVRLGSTRSGRRRPRRRRRSTLKIAYKTVGEMGSGTSVADILRHHLHRWVISVDEDDELGQK